MFGLRYPYSLGLVLLLSLVVGLVIPPAAEALGIQFGYGDATTTLVSIFISLGAGAVAYFLYQRTQELLPISASVPLGIFRYLVMLLVGLLFLEPKLENRNKLSAPPVIAILHDDSESLVIHRDSQYVKTEYPAQLEKFVGSITSDKVTPHFFGFSQQLHAGMRPDSLRYARSGTNISGALEETARLFGNQNLGAVVLVSDGIATSGTNALYTLDQFQQPIYTVLLGDTTPQKDIQIAEVLFNEIAYLDNETPIKVKIHSTGYTTANLNVSIRGGGKTLGSQVVTVDRNTPNVDVDFMVKPDRTGIMQFSISVDPLPDELTTRNNYKAVFINVLETKVKLALFAGYPHPDVGALRMALKRDERYEVTEFIHQRPTTWYTDPLAYNLADYDLFVLHNFPFSQSDAGMAKLIAAEAEKRKVPLMVFVGQHTDLSVLNNELGEYMGILPGAVVRGVDEAQPEFKAEYTNHSTYTFEDGWIRLMNSAPPLYRNQSEWKASGDTRVFATARIKNVSLDYPIYGLQNHLGRKNMVFVGENIWRMRAHTRVETGEFTAFDTWLYNNIQWLIVREDKRRFKVTPSKRLFTGNEPILFRGEAYDESYNPLSGVDIKLTLKYPDGKSEDLYMLEPGTARYFYELRNLEEGTYQYEATGTKNDVTIGTDRGEFSIGRSNIEHFQLTADKGMLEQIALRTGGEFYTAREMDQLAEKINQLGSLKPVVSYVTKRIGFNEYLWIFFVLLTLLSVEWIVRKRYSLS